MYVNRCLKPLLLLLCLLVFLSGANAQVKYAFTQDTLEIKAGNTFANILRVSNPYGQTVALVQDPRHKPLTRGLISLPDTLVLKAGEQKSFPLKYLADRQTIGNNLQEFAVVLVAVKAGLSVQPIARFTTQLGNVSGLTIGTETDEVYLSQLSNQAQVIVRVANNGFVPVNFKLLLTGIPDGLEFTGQTTNLMLLPGSQQLFPFLARNKAGSRTTPDFTVTIQAIDAGNNQLASKMIRVVNVTSARTIGSSQTGGALPNSVALRYGSFSGGSYYYQVAANGKWKTGKNESLEYHFNADQYHQAEYKGINIYDTYLDYQARYWGLKVGNIYENIDFQMGGKGVKASAKMNNGGAFSVLGVENNYLLYDQLGNTRAGARIYALDYKQDIASTLSGRRFTALHSEDPYTGVNASQLSLRNAFRLAENNQLSVEGGFSKEEQNVTGAISENGYAGGLSYGLLTEALQINASGYYSTPYYTGLRRGLTYSDLRVAKNIAEQSSLIAHISVQVNNPRYQSTQFNLENLLNQGINKNAIYQYELGYQVKTGNFTYGFGPYFMDQRLIAAGYNQTDAVTTDWKSQSMRLNANVGYTGMVHSFSVVADYGYTFFNSSAQPPAPFHSLKLTTNYRMPILGFSSYIQLNPFYLSDGLNSLGQGSKFNIYSFGPNAHFTAFKGRLAMQAGGLYSHYGFTRTSNVSANGNFRYALKGHWTVTADAQYVVTKQKFVMPFTTQDLNMVNAYNDLRNNSRQFRVGIEKQFGLVAGTPNKKLELSYYEDRNSNGQRDPGENPVDGVLVKIGGDVALTNSKGYVEFKNMEKKGYTVSITNTKGWSLQEPTDVFLDKSKMLEIPLVKTQALNGTVKPITDQYLKSKPALAGIKISAKDENGRIHQTLTDDQGAFCFYLPRNKYTVYIETEGLPFSIENAREEVLLKGDPVKMLTFIYKDERRKIAVSHF
jgi:hypothetical protein